MCVHFFSICVHVYMVLACKHVHVCKPTPFFLLSWLLLNCLVSCHSNVWVMVVEPVHTCVHVCTGSCTCMYWFLYMYVVISPHECFMLGAIMIEARL